MAILVGWLLLPSRVGFNPVGLPLYSKFEAISLGVILGCLIFEWPRLARLRWHILDVAVLIACVSPAATSLTNGLGPHDALSEVYGNFLLWGVPYLMGRAFFGNLVDIRTLILGLFIAGLLFSLLCIWEIRMSPQLQRWVYGFDPAKFSCDREEFVGRPASVMKTASD